MFSIRNQSVKASTESRRFPKLRIGPSGAHFFDRSSGFNFLIDEISFPPEEWSPVPRYVSVALTNACELHCAYCYAPKHPSTLHSTQLLSWLEELDANGCLGVGFGGGEPTLYREFSKLCRTVSQSTSLAVTFTTHGHRIDKELAAELHGSVHFVRVSMDGVGPTYEALRGKPFSSLLTSISAVRDISPFGINYIVNSQTLPDINAAIAIASESGASEFLLLPEQPSRAGTGIDARTTEALHDWVINYQGPVPLRVSEAGAEGLPVCDPFSAETGLRAYGHIDSSGMVKRSSFDSFGVPIGSAGVVEALVTLALSDGST